MRLLHTADWHLGHTLRGHTRHAEHAHFLRWLVRTVVERGVDALLLAGDVFDASNPPPPAWRLWFQFLGELKRARPGLQVVVIAGNHDSAARLEAPRDLLASFDVRVVGSIARAADGRLATDDLLVPLRGATGAEAALCVAIPFLRSSDVMALAPPTDTAEADPLIDGMRALHQELFAAARARRRPGQALLALAHGYLVGGATSELSERKVLGGNQHALPIDLFPDDCAYVALGHLHRPQPLGGRDHVRYSGSPIPLSMPEREHAHHVVFADLDGERLRKVWSLRVPRLVPLWRIPERGALEPDAALAALAALPERGDGDDELRPLLEVAVCLPQPSPAIGERIAQAAAGKDVRLVRVDVQRTGDGGVLQAGGGEDLTALQPEQVFVRRYRRDHDGEVPPALLAAFRQLLDEVEHGAPR
ncbi:MAG: exonuclease SbcCD subunit D C-terminal domain-containing protein [Planctomycetes bacterium]|nr:exonuclease SbcCD subunit D C-terminal domain-containing protein [Planctomycetota bacterium]